MAELDNGELLRRLARRGPLGAFAWELALAFKAGPPLVAQRLRHMADDPLSPVERVPTRSTRKRPKFRVTESYRRALRKEQDG